MLDKIGLEKEVDARMLMMRMIDRNIHRQSKKCPNADLVLSLGVFLAVAAPCDLWGPGIRDVDERQGVPQSASKILHREATLSANTNIWGKSQTMILRFSLDWHRFTPPSIPSTLNQNKKLTSSHFYKQEQIVLERSARLNLDPGRGDGGDG